MGKYVPEFVLENRSELGRQLLSDRYFLIHRKKLLTALVLFFIVGGLGVHRFYFKQWIWGAIVIGVSILFLCIPFFEETMTNGEGSFLLILAPIPVLAFFVFEFAMIFRNTKMYNAILANEIKSEAGVI